MPKATPKTTSKTTTKTSSKTSPETAAKAGTNATAKAATSTPSNRRAHLRYRDPESTVHDFVIDPKDDQESSFKALVVNESFTGLAVVYVGDRKINKGDTIFWRETSQLLTPCQVIRNTCIDDDIYTLALKLE